MLDNIEVFILGQNCTTLKSAIKKADNNKSTQKEIEEIFEMKYSDYRIIVSEFCKNV